MPKPRKRKWIDIPREKVAERQKAADRLWSHRAVDRAFFRGKRGHDLFRAKVQIGNISLLPMHALRRTRKLYEEEMLMEKNGHSIKAVIEKHMKKRGKRKVRVLDVGCGRAAFLRDLVKDFKQIEAHGITLVKPASRATLEKLKADLEKELRKEEDPVKREVKRERILHRIKDLEKESANFYRETKEHNIDVRVGSAEAYNFGGKKFDVIFSNWAFPYFVNPKQALRNTLTQLAEGGEAFISFKSSHNIPEHPEIKKWLDTQGFKVEFFGEYEDRSIYRFKRTK